MTVTVITRLVLDPATEYKQIVELKENPNFKCVQEHSAIVVFENRTDTEVVSQ